MIMKKYFKYLFSFMLLISLFIAFNSYPVIADNVIDQSEKVQQNTCPGLQVFNQQVNANLSFAFASVSGVYNASQYDYNSAPESQTGITNYYTTSSSYINGYVNGIQLPEGTYVVVTGKDFNNNAFFMNCQPGPVNTYGVNPGDSLTYQFKTNATNKIPFFGLYNNTPVAQNNDKIQIIVDQILNPGIILRISVGQNSEIKINETMFFIVPMNELKDVISGNFQPDPNSDGPQPIFVSTNSANTTVKLESQQVNATMVVDNMHGNLIYLDGNFSDPNNNIIKMQFILIGAVFNSPPDNSNQETPTWGVQVGDTFKLQFHTNVTGEIPFMDLNNGQAKISEGDVMTIEITNLVTSFSKVDQTSQSGSPLTLRMTIGNQTPFETTEGTFFVVPTNTLEGLISGNASVGDNNTNVVLIYANDTVASFEMIVDNGNGNIKLTIDRKHGTLIGFDGVFTDPSGNGIQMKLNLIDSSFKISDTTTSTTDSNVTITQSIGGFEFISVFPIIGIALIVRKRANHQK